MIVNDKTLTAAAVEGDRAALGELLARHHAELHEKMSRRIAEQYRSAFDPGDVLQVTYLEAFLRIKEFRPRGSASFLSWLLRIAENNVIDLVRELERDKRPPRNRQIPMAVSDDSFVDFFSVLVGPATTPTQVISRAEAKELLAKALDELPADYRTAVTLYDLEGMPAGEVAEAMGRSAHAVHMLRARAHEHLKGMLGTGTNFF